MISPTTRENDLARAALTYAARGWRVFPCHHIVNGLCSCSKAECPSPGKHPRVQHGVNDATTSELQIRQWWKKWPHANIAIATGLGLFVVDIDVSRNGIENWESLKRDNDEFIALETLTGGGGRHLFFSCNRPIKNSVDLVANGVDIRGDGGYVIAAPSNHKSGREYTWELSSDPVEDPSIKVPEAPGWLQAKLNGLTLHHTKPTTAQGLTAVAKGGRNDFLFRLGRSLRAKGLDEDSIRGALIETNEKRCSPPLDPSEVKQIATSSCKPKSGVSSEELVKLSLIDRPIPDAPEDIHAGAPVYDPDKEPDWTDKLRRTAKGEVEHTFGNICLYLRCHETFAGRLKYDDMALSPLLDNERVTDELLGRLREQLERMDLVVGLDTLSHAVYTVSSECRFHPVREYLDSLKWDGVPRISRFATLYLGCDERDPLDDDLCYRWLISAVARTYQPGCKADCILVLCGPQGARKSSALSALGGMWFSDSPIDISNKDSVMQIRSAWLYELAEIDAITSKKDASAVKAFVSVSKDRIRPPYGRTVDEYPRQSVFCGSTNKTDFLHDETGSRRFWIVPIDSMAAIDVPKITHDRDQLWAEAVDAYRKGIQWWLGEVSDEARADRANGFLSIDPWEHAVWTWAVRQTDYFTIPDLMVTCIGKRLDDVTRSDQTRLGIIMTKLGFKKRRVNRAGKQFYAYQPVIDTPNETTE